MTSVAENRALAELAYDRGDVVLKNRPEVFAIESTNFCNIKCVMCPRGEPDIMRRTLGHMGNDTLRKIIDQAQFFTDPTWLHWFGEPLMNPNLFEQIRIAKEKVPNLGISTNATLLHANNQQKILESGLDTIMIAIDGDTKETYEQTRKSDRFGFERVTGHVEEFLARRKAMGQSKLHVCLSIIVMEQTKAETERFRDHWLASGADEILFKPYGNWAGQYSEIFDDFETVERRARLKSPRPHPCQHLWTSLVISWDGKVVPCCFDYDAKPVLGDLNTQTLDEIWNGPAYVALREAELAGRNMTALCANCQQAPGRLRQQSVAA